MCLGMCEVSQGKRESGQGKREQPNEGKRESNMVNVSQPGRPSGYHLVNSLTAIY